MSSMNWLDTLFGGGGLLLGGGLMGLVKRSLGSMLKDMIDVALKDLKQDLVELKLKFAAETGGNSNGLRQKLNDVAEDVAHLKGKVGE